MSDFWKRGYRALIAFEAGISQAHLSEILYRKRGVNKYRAKALEISSRKVLGFAIPWQDWLFNESTDHPAFFGKERRNK